MAGDGPLLHITTGYSSYNKGLFELVEYGKPTD